MHTLPGAAPATSRAALCVGVTCLSVTVGIASHPSLTVPPHSQVTHILRRALRNVAGGGLSSFDGRERYQLVGRDLTGEEKAARVLYCWDAERFMCPGFLHLLPDGGKDVPLELLKDNA